MYGDSLNSGTLFISGGDDSGMSVTGDVVLPSFGSLKIADNNSPIPVDRVYFMYQHFHNAIRSGFVSDFGESFTEGKYDLNLFTLGFEKTFLDELASIDVRLPLASSNSPALSFANPVGFEPGTLTGIGLIVKGILCERENMVLAAGLGMNIPTGASHSNIYQADETYKIDREGVTLTPFLGLATSFTERGFFQGFLQVSVPTTEDTISVESDFDFVTTPIDQRNLFTVNLSKGHWFCRQPVGSCLTGLAGIIELHYTSTLGEDTSTDFFSAGYNYAAYERQRFDALNLTSGLLLQFHDCTNVRIGAVAPLRTGYEDKMFDAEVHASINYYF